MIEISKKNIESIIFNLDRNDPLAAYIYDLNVLSSHVKYLKSTLPKNVKIFYAVKANPDLKVLSKLKNQIDGFEVASKGELLRCLDISKGQKKIAFSGPGKTDEEICVALKNEIDSFHVESFYELKRLNYWAKKFSLKVKILIRMNLNYKFIKDNEACMGGKSVVFGFCEKDIPKLLSSIKRMKNVSFFGFHFHLVSLLLCYKKHLKIVESCLSKVKEWQKKYDIEVNIVNLGGGIGINYEEPELQYDWDQFSIKLKKILKKYLFDKVRVRFEFGRFVPSSSGVYVSEVLDIKTNLDQNFAICRGGTHHFRTPRALQHNHPFWVINVKRKKNFYTSPSIKSAKITAVGQQCSPYDIFFKNKKVEKLKVGDLFVFRFAGSYAWNISPHMFLMHDPPQFFYIE